MNRFKKYSVLFMVIVMMLSVCVHAAEPEQAPVTEPKKLVALTFDDGPDAKMTEPVLDVLEKYGVRATFFLLGCKINETTAPLVERTLSLGCEVGYHGYEHRNMTKISLEMIQKQIRQFMAVWDTYMQIPAPIKLVRAPGGNSNKKVLRAVGELGYAMVLWEVDSADWKVQIAEKINATVQKKVQDGSIVLMHDRHRPTVDALELLIPSLLEQGYEFVTVSELLTRNGDEIEAGKEYRFMRLAETAAIN